ncbi:MAG: lactate racemase domain-containing protein, partial [Terriglobales bacterium]
MPVMSAVDVIGKGKTDRYLDDAELREIVEQGIEAADLRGKRVLMLIPDGTRTMPMGQMFRIFDELLRPHVPALDYLVALGTHPPMSDEQLSKMVGRSVVNGWAGTSRVFNHHWEDPKTFVSLGTIPADEVKELTRGHLAQD